MRWRSPHRAVSFLLVSSLVALGHGCTPAVPEAGPVWLITFEAGDAPGETAPWPGETAPWPGEPAPWPGAIASKAACFPMGHAVSPELGDQWLSLWTGYWPRTLEGADLERVPSLLRDLRAGEREVRAWLPPMSPGARGVLTDLGLGPCAERGAGQQAGAGELEQHWAAACDLWARWCATGTAGLLWLHLDAGEASRFGELLGLRPEAEFTALGGSSGRIWAVELGGPPDPRTDSPTRPDTWSRLGDLEERRLAARAWVWSADAAGGDRPWCTPDLAPTLAAALGLPGLFAGDQAHDLGGPEPGYRVLVGERRGATHRRQVAWVGDLKLWRAAQPLERGGPTQVWAGDHPRLFDWRVDPDEREDLGVGNADRVLQLENVFRLWEDQRRIRRRAAQRRGWWIPAERDS